MVWVHVPLLMIVLHSPPVHATLAKRVESKETTDDCLLSLLSPVKANIKCGYGFKEGASLIKGFDIRVEGQKRGYRCIAIELSEAIASPRASFSGALYSMEQNKQYVITVQSLPRNNVSGTVETFVTTRECVANPSGSWAVKQFNITYDAYGQRLHVSFESPPSAFGFEEFSINVWSLDYSIAEHAIINKTKHSFENIPPGEYDITLQPHDPYFQREGRCKCRNSRHICSSCTMSETRYVALAAVARKVVQEQSSVKVIAITCALAITVLAVVVVILAVFRRQIWECLKSNQQRCIVSKQDKNDCSRLLLVFIDATEDLTHMPKDSNKVSHVRTHIEDYKKQILLDANVRIENTVLNLTDDLNSKLSDVTKSCFQTVQVANTVSCEQNNVAKQIENADGNQCVVCCFVLPNIVTLDNIKAINESIVNCSVGSSICISNVALIFYDVGPELDALSSAMKCYKVPKEHTQFIRYIESLAGMTNNGHSEETSSQDPQCVAITVNLDKDSSCNRAESNININPNTSRMEILLRLDVPRSSRERYTSNDSGRGGSVNSLKGSTIDASPEDLEMSDENENMCLLSEHYFDHCQTTPNHFDGELHPPYRCPSHIDFAPPEPSEVSESDILENYRKNYIDVPNEYNHGSGVGQCCNRNGLLSLGATCDECDGGEYEEVVRLGRRNNNSPIDSIMSKMAAINARSLHIMDVERNSGETYSVFECSA